MYYRLIRATKATIIDRIRQLWADHPKYNSLTQNVVGKYSQDARPNYGIVVKVGGGSRIDLSADNFLQVEHSYVCLSSLKNYRCTSIEWVYEDKIAIQNNNGVFPSRPGVYYIDLISQNSFMVDCLYNVNGQHLELSPSRNTAFIQPPFRLNTLRIYEQPSGFRLSSPENFSVSLNSSGEPDGNITFTTPIPDGCYLTVDYKVPGESTGPHFFEPSTINHTAIPGCMLAFGDRTSVNDKGVVVVSEVREPTALVYGGMWDLNFDIDIMSRDVDSNEEITDQMLMYVWGVLRSQLIEHGILLTDFQFGGETEDIYDDNGNDYYYNSAISMTVQVEYNVFVPVQVYLRSISEVSSKQMAELARMSDEEISRAKTNMGVMDEMGMVSFQDPFYTTRG